VAVSGSLAPRVETLDGQRLGLLSTGKKNCDALLEQIGDLLEERFDVAGRRMWTKASVYKFGSLRQMTEIKETCDVVVAGLGDCGHGSSCTLHDVYWLEEQGIPVAYVDTPGRMHKVSREDGIFVVDYWTLKYVVRDYKKAALEERPAYLRKQLEKQGVYRALRVAGARPGDRVRLLDLEIEMEELPEPPRNWLPDAEGIRDYPVIVTDAVGRLSDAEIAQRAEELLPRVIETLVMKPL
jgi:Obg family GTPase CgtA-like protein